MTFRYKRNVGPVAFRDGGILGLATFEASSISGWRHVGPGVYGPGEMWGQRHMDPAHLGLAASRAGGIRASDIWARRHFGAGGIFEPAAFWGQWILEPLPFRADVAGDISLQAECWAGGFSGWWHFGAGDV